MPPTAKLKVSIFRSERQALASVTLEIDGAGMQAHLVNQEARERAYDIAAKGLLMEPPLGSLVLYPPHRIWRIEIVEATDEPIPA